MAPLRYAAKFDHFLSLKDRNSSTSSSAGSILSGENFYDKWGLDVKPPKRNTSPPSPSGPLPTPKPPQMALPPQLKDKKIELQKMVIDEQRNRLRYVGNDDMIIKPSHKESLNLRAAPRACLAEQGQ